MPAGAAWDPERPLATFVDQQGALRLEALCARARAAGLAPGMMLADARAMVPALQVQAAEPAADARLLEDLAAWCERYTPYVALDRSHEHAAGGGALAGRHRLRPSVRRRGGVARGPARPSAPPGPGCGGGDRRYARRRLGGRPLRRTTPIVPPGGARVALAPLPVAALRLDPDTVQMLERLGLERIESLYPLPRRALVARFGDALTTRLDQAEGLVDEPISPRPPPPAHRAQLAFAEPIAQADALAPVTRRLLAELCSGLAAASLGARRLTLAFYRVDNSTAAVAIGTSRPCRDARQLERLFAEKLEQVDLGFGIERAILEAAVVEPLLPEPLAWRAMGAGDLDQARDLAPLVDRLSNRLGPDAVSQLAPRASHIPERAQARVPALSPGAAAPFARAWPAWPGAGPAAAPARAARADRGGRPLARRAAGAVPLAPGAAQGRHGARAGAPGARMVARAGCRSGDRDPRLLRGRGHRGRPLLAVPRGPLPRRRGHAAVVPARAVRLNVRHEPPWPMTAYAELQITSNFSFLRGGSHPEELVLRAAELGLSALALTDRNTLAGVVRAHIAAKEVGIRFVVGARLDLMPEDGTDRSSALRSRCRNVRSVATGESRDRRSRRSSTSVDQRDALPADRCRNIGRSEVEDARGIACERTRQTSTRPRFSMVAGSTRPSTWPAESPAPGADRSLGSTGRAPMKPAV